MQPTYLPWIGYFQLISKVDVFIFLDDVQFDKRSWQQRNIINNKGKKLYLTVPILSKGKFHQKINETVISDEQNWKKKHLSSIKNIYSKSNFFEEIYSNIQNIFDKDIRLISELNIQLIKSFVNYLGIKTKFINSSKIKTSGEKEFKIINILRELKSNHYISPPGSVSYISKDNFLKNQIKLEFIDYKLDNYYYPYNNFYLENMSIIDLLFYRGKKSINFI